jgi:RNA polymerase sigma factor (TIGR02999 family)
MLLQLVRPMNEVTRILSVLQHGDAGAAAEQLLPLVYEELRKLAAQRLTHEAPGQTLQATALVHEAYLRLIGAEAEVCWHGRGHFFAAAAEAMRRILVERARHRQRLRHGGGRKRVDLDVAIDSPAGAPDVQSSPDELLALDEALTRLAAEAHDAAEVVKLRYFAGLTIQQSADALGISVRTANRHWTYAKAWLFQQLADRGDAGP